MKPPPETLLSLPPHMCQALPFCEPQIAQTAFAAHDPPDAQLGSGGGTAHLLVEAWRGSGVDSFRRWIGHSRKIVVHGGGESRRLPAYAAMGKLFIPLPALRWSRGQRLDQSLLDLQQPFLRQVFARAGAAARLMIASGDVLLRAGEHVHALPDADVVLLGMWASPESARHYGVMFCDRRDPQKLLSFLQKPDPDVIRERSRHSLFLIDVGVWLLSEQAVRCLMTKCGWDEQEARFRDGHQPWRYDLYGQWALHLGAEPEHRDDRISQLSVAIAAFRKGEFYHFGTSRDLLDSMYALQNVVQDQTILGPVPSLAQPRQFIQNADFNVPVRRQENESLWVENSCIPASWKLASRHLLTGVPHNDWSLQLPSGVCLDFVPVSAQEVAIRAYGFSDSFRGSMGDAATAWQEAPVRSWFDERHLNYHDAGITPATDIQHAALFPVVRREDLSESFVEWLYCIRANDPQAETHGKQWLTGCRLSARDLTHRADLTQIYEQRNALRVKALPVMLRHGANSVFYKLDLARVARQFAESQVPLAAAPVIEDSQDLMLAVHDRMFRSAVLRHRHDRNWRRCEDDAFRLLERAIVTAYKRVPVHPQCNVAEDQIVWARSPVRIDLAGGWTDTPPYCMEQGGSVVNLAVNLNGQPPIQVFARKTSQFALTVRSIDLGISEQLTSYDEVGNYRGLTSGFCVARAALAMCGFHPDFNGQAHRSLVNQLQAMGGGLDISMLAALPKGSGLGTSSILAGTLLGALSELCGLGWDLQAICARVSAVEQMLGSGGGWQDQYGGLVPGAKIIETQPGAEQLPAIRWLPADFFAARGLGECMLLYYTGFTRVAHDVLGEIVRGMFLNDPARLDVLDAIRVNSRVCFDAVQRWHREDFSATVRRSWELNQALDCGTNPAQVQAIAGRIESRARALKLAGAGGGGFMFMIARDEPQAGAIRRELEENRPNERARFLQLSLSKTGLQVTRS